MPRMIAIDRNKLEQMLPQMDGEHILLFGPPGTGKTTLAQRTFAKLGRAFFSWTFTEQQSAAAGWGHYIPKGNEMQWHHGPFAMAWLNGAGLIANEVGHMSEDVSNSAHALLDNPEVAEINLPSGVKIKPQKGYFCIATDNRQPDVLHPAVMDRLTIRVMVDRPSDEMIAKLLTPLRDYCVKIYKTADPERGPEVTYRELAKITELSQKFDLLTAVQLVIPENEKATALHELIRIRKAA